ncbi:serine hydrolase domain-containing protein [Amycolatopsis minnesotensis]|uniref:Serine hydrolase domain-containing protein n=1 Tax=Amycolatopsis minnesotensis TaxID=337894 RepID=A0ABN2RWC6_9PSEU
MDELALTTALAEVAARHGVPDARLVVHDGDRTLLAQTGSAVTDRTAFPLGSLTKPFTATLVMTLVEDGDVDLDTSLVAYLPELADDAGVTPRLLLSHLAGLPSDVDEGEDARTREQWAAEHCRAGRLAHPPGAAFSYSNAGYLMAGRLVEAVTGMAWADAVDTFLLRPLGIEPAFVTGPPSRRPIATGHVVHPVLAEAQPVAAEAMPAVEAPNGALALSADDLVAFARLHMTDPALPRPLTEDTLAAMRLDQTAGAAVGPFGLADGWGLGWALYRDGDTVWYGHDGMTDGGSCHLRFDPVRGTAVAATTNASTGAAMWGDLVAALHEHGLSIGDYPFTTVPDGPAQEAPADCLGGYVNGGHELTVTPGDDGGLRLAIDTAPHSTLSCFDDLRFAMRDLGAGRLLCVGRFLREPGATGIDLLQFTGRLARRAAAPR